MTKLTYRPGAGDPQVTTWGRIEFAAGVPTEAPDDLVEKAKNNPQFDVEGYDKTAVAQAAELERAKKTVAAIEAEAMAIDARQEAEIAELEKKHNAEQDAFRHRTNGDFVWAHTVIAEAKLRAAEQQGGDKQPPAPNPATSPAPEPTLTQQLAAEGDAVEAQPAKRKKAAAAFVDDADPRAGQ